MTNGEILDKVLFVGPDLRARGGMASVLASYSRVLKPFHYVRTNSRRGSVFNVTALAGALLRLPFQRLAGRKIMHVHSAGWRSFTRKSIIISWAKLLGFKVVYHSHSGGFAEFIKERGRDKVLKVLNRCQTIVVLSNSWLEYFTNELGLDNVVVVKNPAEQPAVIPCKENPAELRLFYMGAINHAKGVYDMVDVISEIRQELDGRLKLRIGGNGEVEQLQRLIKGKGLEDYIEFVGWVTGDKKAELMGWMDCLILPSYKEGVPISILEAMACGKPVISTAVGGIPEIVTSGENGILFTPGDKTALKEAIECYISNRELLHRHGSVGKEKVKPYLIENLPEALLAIYRPLLK